MGQITRTTNPTNLRLIDQKHFVVRTRNDASTGREFWLESFNYSAANFDPATRMFCIAHAGSTEVYFDLGTVSQAVHTPISLHSLATDKPLRFRFIFNSVGASLLTGYADGIRALDEAGALGSSLVDIEPTDLNGLSWRLVLPEGLGAGDKPNVLVERALFPTAVLAVNHPWFGILVMPEVMRQIAMAIAENPAALDDVGTWIAPWADFLFGLGVEALHESQDDDTAKLAWSEEVVERFIASGIFKHQMAQAMAELERAPE